MNRSSRASVVEDVQRIPQAALERSEQAFLAVLRCRHPECLFVVRDGAVAPDDLDIALEVAARAPVDDDAIEEPG